MKAGKPSALCRGPSTRCQSRRVHRTCGRRLKVAGAMFFPAEGARGDGTLTRPRGARLRGVGVRTAPAPFSSAGRLDGRTLSRGSARQRAGGLLNMAAHPSDPSPSCNPCRRLGTERLRAALDRLAAARAAGGQPPRAVRAVQPAGLGFRDATAGRLPSHPKAAGSRGTWRIPCSPRPVHLLLQYI